MTDNSAIIAAIWVSFLLKHVYLAISTIVIGII